MPPAEDFRIVVHVIEADSIVTRADVPSATNCWVAVYTNGIKIKTAIKMKVINETQFGDKLEGLVRGVDRATFMDSIMTFKMFHKKKWGGKTLIGSLSFRVGEIYNMSNHQLSAKWLGLLHVGYPDEEQAQVKVTCAVLGPGEISNVARDMNEEVKLPFTPVTREPYAITVKIHLMQIVDDELEPITGLLATSLEFESREVKTKFKPQNDAGTVMRSLVLLVHEPLMNDMIAIRVHCKQLAFGVSTCLGTIFLSYETLKSSPINSVWFNMYAAPLITNDQEATMEMNMGLAVGSLYRGRLLLSTSVELDDDGDLYDGVYGCTRPALPSLTDYTLQCDFYEGTDLPERHGKKCSLVMSIGPHQVIHGPQQIKKSRLQLYEPLPDIKNIKMPLNTTMCPDIFIYLKDARQRNISFARFPFKQVCDLEFKVPPKWFALKEDTSMDFVTAPDNPGCFLISLRAGQSSKLPTRHYQVSRPLASGGGPYATQLYQPLPEIPVDHKDINTDKESEKVALFKNYLSKAEVSAQSSKTVVASAGNDVGELSVEIINTENVPDIGATRAVVSIGTQVETMKHFVSIQHPEEDAKSKQKKKKKKKKKDLDESLLGDEGERVVLLPYQYNHKARFEAVSVDHYLAIKIYKKGKIKDELVSENYLDVSETVNMLMEKAALAQIERRAAQLAKGVAMEEDDSMANASINTRSLKSRDLHLPFSDKYTEGTILINMRFNFIADPKKAEKARLKVIADNDKILIQQQNVFNRLIRWGPSAVPLAPKTEIGRPTFRSFQLRGYLYLANRLPRMSSSGRSRPGVVVRCAGKSIQISPSSKTTNPRWFRTLTMNVTLPLPLELAPDIGVFLFHYHKKKGGTPSGMCWFRVSASKARVMNPALNKIRPEWFHVKDFDDNQLDEDTKILASFQLLSINELMTAKIPKILDTQKPKFINLITVCGSKLADLTLAKSNLVPVTIPLTSVRVVHYLDAVGGQS